MAMMPDILLKAFHLEECEPWNWGIAQSESACLCEEDNLLKFSGKMDNRSLDLNCHCT